MVKPNFNKGTKARLAKNHACYILITCDEIQSDGNMQVKMTYEGDPILAACLLQGAQALLDEQAEESYQAELAGHV